jgi:hypothetical protein
VKIIPFIVLIIIGFIVLLPIIIRNRKNNNSLIKLNTIKKYDFKYIFIDYIKTMSILVIVFLVLFIIYLILSKTLLKGTIENYNNQTIENALIIQDKIYPILKTNYDIPIEIKFNKWIEKGTNYNVKPPIRYGIYEFGVYHQNSIDNIRVEWEIIENIMIVKSISKYFGKESENIYINE